MASVLSRWPSPADMALFRDFSDPDVFGAFYQQHFSHLVWYFRSTFQLTEEDAEDIVQEGFLKLWHGKTDVLSRVNNPYTYARYIMRHDVFSHHKRNLHPVAAAQSLDGLFFEEQRHAQDSDVRLATPVAVSPEQQAMVRQELQTVAQRLPLLTQIEKKVFTLLVQGYAPHEIGTQIQQQFGIAGNPTAVSHRLKQVRRKLRGEQVLKRFTQHERFVCCECGSSERPHASHGRCTTCRTRWVRRHTVLPVTTGMKPPLPKRWSKDHDACVVCGTTTHPHEGKGMCHPCYHRAFRHQWHLSREQHAHPVY